MTRAAGVGSIDCPACGAGLSVLGGGRVTTHVCGYCGTELDALNGYAALRRFTEMERPGTPLRIGDTGTIHGVAFTVIGILGLREDWQGKVWTWVDHEIYSPTHGYGVMTLEDGHLTFTRRYRKTGRFISVTEVESAEHRPSVRVEGETYRYYDTSVSEITFAEGEFTWQPEIGMRVETVTALASDAMLGFTRTESEREIERTTYLPQAATWASFGVSDPPKALGTHPTQRVRRGRHQAFIRNSGLIFAALCIVLALVLPTIGRQTVLPQQVFALSDLPVEVPVEITRTDRLAQLSVAADVQNSWAYFDLALVDPGGAPLFEAGREVGFYTGTSSDGRWSEGSNTATLRFHPTVSGTYTVELDLAEADTWNRAGRPLSQVSVRMEQGVAGTFWLKLLALVFVIVALAGEARYFLQKARRWSGSDWSDED